MEKFTITVPKGIQYLGQWEGFSLPNGLFNKGLTGCGGSELLLCEPSNSILASPRVKLIECKSQQHPETTLLVIGKMRPDQIKAEIEGMVARGVQFIKVLTTYDSLPKVIKALGDEVSDYNLCLDEYQLLLLDASFKSQVELKVLEYINVFKRTTLMSATPLLEEVIKEVPQLNDLPYTELVWPETERIEVRRMKCNKPKVAVTKIIADYQNGIYPSIITDDGKVVESHEAVFFLNSVQAIVNIVAQTGLKNSEVNIMVGNTSENDKLLADLSAKMDDTYVNGNAPLKGEIHKMITLCTSTCYAGVDFYSTNALSFIIVDVHGKNTTLSPEYELTQIAGRQRLVENPFRKVLYLIYNTLRGDIDEADFEAEMQEKLTLTQQEIDNDNATEDRLRKKRIHEREKEQQALNFGSTWNYYNRETDRFELNTLKMLSERHAYHVQQKVFYDGLLTTMELTKSRRFELVDGEDEQLYVFEESLQNSIQRTSFEAKMQRYVQYREDTSHRFDLAARQIEAENENIKAFYDTLGGKTITALQYKEANLEQELVNRKNEGRVLLAYMDAFPVGSEWSTQQIKATMTDINARLAILYRGKPRKGKVSDLQNEWSFTIEQDRKSKLHTIIAHPSAEKMSSLL